MFSRRVVALLVALPHLCSALEVRPVVARLVAKGCAVASLAASLPAAAVPAPDPAAARVDVLSAAATLESLSLSNRGCARSVLRGAPFTDESLPKVGGNVPKSAALFRGNYERPLPTVGNALRRSINAVEASMTFEVRAPARGGRETAAVAGGVDALYAERASQNAVATLDYLDLLRNDWLDAVQLLEAELDDGGDGAAYDATAARNALASSKQAARAWIAAARPPGEPPAPRPLCSE